MAQNNNNKKSEGICEKIHNAVSPFRPRIRRISDQPRLTGDINSVKTSSPQTKPVHVLHHSKTIPVELRHSAAKISAQNSKKDSDEREVKIIRGQKFAKSASRKEEHVRFAKTTSEKDEDHHEGKFSDYISKVKYRMMKTASHVGGGGGGGNSTRRDSFNDKVTNYIDKAKIKIRTTTTVGVEQNHN